EPRVTGLPPGHYWHASLASQRALLAQARGEVEAARADHDRAVALAEKRDAQGKYLLRRSSFELEYGAAEPAQSDAARTLVLEQAAVPGAFSSRVGLARLALARALRAQGKVAEAGAAAAAARQQLEPALGVEHPDSRVARQMELELLSDR